MPSVVVAHLMLLDEVKTMLSEVVGIAEQLGHIHCAKISREIIVCSVPAIDKIARCVFSCAVFTIRAELERWIPVSEMELVTVADVSR